MINLSLDCVLAGDKDHDAGIRRQLQTQLEQNRMLRIECEEFQIENESNSKSHPHC